MPDNSSHNLKDAVTTVTLATSMMALSRPLEEVLNQSLPRLVKTLGAAGAYVRNGGLDKNSFVLAGIFPEELKQTIKSKINLKSDENRRLKRTEILTYLREPDSQKFPEPGFNDSPFNAVTIMGLNGPSGLLGTLVIGFAAAGQLPAELGMLLAMYAQALATGLERQHTQKRLLLLENTINHTSDAVMILETPNPEQAKANTAPRIVYANPAFSAKIGLQSADILGRSWEVLRSAGLWPQALDNLVTSLRQGKAARAEFAVPDAGSDSRWLELDVKPIFAASVITHYLGLMRDISARKQGEQHLAHLARFRQALIEVVSDALTHGLDEKFYQRLLETAVAVIPNAQAGSIFIRDKSGRYFVCAAVGYELASLSQVRLTLDELTLSLDTKDYCPRIIEKIGQANKERIHDEAVAILDTFGRAQAIQVAMSLPVVVSGQLEAILFFDNFDKQDAFDQESVEIAEIFAKQIGVVLQRLRLQDDAEHQASFQATLLEMLNDALTEGVDNSFYQRLVGRAVTIIPGANAGSILLKQNDKRYHFVAAVNYDLSELAKISLARHELHFGPGEIRRASYLTYKLSDINEQNLDSESQRRLTQAGRTSEIKVSLAVPIMLRGELVAVLALDSTDSAEAFDDDSCKMAEAFGAQIALVLQRLRLQSQAEQRAKFQHLLASLERLLLEFDDLEGFFPRLAEMLLHETGIGATQLAFFRLRQNGVFDLELFGADAERTEEIRTALDAAQALDLEQSQSMLAEDARARKKAYYPDVKQLPQWIDLGISEISSLLRHPLKQNGQLWGIFDIVSDQTDAFGKEVQELISQVASSIELALAKQADRQSLQNEFERMQSVVRAHEALREASSLSEVYERALNVLMEQTVARSVSFLLYDATSDTLKVAASAGEMAAMFKDAVLTRGTGISWRVFDSKRTLHLPNVEQHPETYYPPETKSRWVADYVGTPLFDDQGQVVGVLAASIEGNDSVFKPSHLSFIEAVAQTCSGAITRLKLLEQSEQEAKAYRALANFGATIEEVNDVEKLMSIGLNSLLEQLHLDMATYHDVNGDYCYPAQIWGSYPPGLIELRNAAPKTVGKGLVGRVAVSGEMVYVPDYRVFPQALADYARLGLATQLVIPVKQRNKVVKVLSISSFERVVPLGEEHFSIARNFVRRLENALERTDNLHEVEATRESTMRSLGLVLEYRDLETKGHTDRVVKLSQRLGQRLGFDYGQLDALRAGAYLHDIGKIAIPDTILLKPGKLEPYEFEVIKRHTLIGVKLCQDILFLHEDTRKIVRSHHERWDGRGYPDGLSGTEIPLMARMFSLVDVYDALTSTRPYKAAWSHGDAVAEISKQAGAQFDPELVEEFLTLLELPE